MSDLECFVNGLQCLNGLLIQRPLYFNVKTGKIIQEPLEEPTIVHDLQGKIIAPAFLELQTNGCAGFHFTHFQNNPETYQHDLRKVAKYLTTTGVGSFWATIPTVSLENFKNVGSFVSCQCIPFPLSLTHGSHAEVSPAFLFISKQ